MLTIHHLGHSQSERIIWLCEELELPYRLQTYRRDTVTRLSPPELKALHPLGAAPLLEVDGLWLAESAAVVDFILGRYGDGRLRYGPEDRAFADYLYWFHLANGTLQPAVLRAMSVGRCGLAPEHPVLIATRERLDSVMGLIDARLSQSDYLAGQDFSAADIMTVFSLTTMRLFYPLDLEPYTAVKAYLQVITARPAYRRAMAKGDPDLAELL